MRKLLFVLFYICATCGYAYALGEGGIVNSGGEGAIGGDIGAIHGNRDWRYLGLTFWAPLDNPSAPLRLERGTGTLSFTRATTATYVHPTTGLITSAASGQLRIESNGALIEGVRTNIALQSETLGTTWVASNIAVVNDNAVAPDGASTAERLTASAGNGTLLQSVTGTAAAYTFSIYLKRLTGTGNVDVRADNTTWATCTISSSAWTRCAATATLTDNTYAPGVRIVTSGDAVYAWGGQMEAGAFESSYIPTTAAAKTRNKDVLIAPLTGNYSLASGTISVEMHRLLSSYAKLLAIGDAGASNTLYLSTDNYGIFDNSAAQKYMGNAIGSGFTRNAVRWNNGSMGQALNGTVYTTTSGGGAGVLSAAQSEMGIGNEWISGADQPNGHIKNLRIWSRALTDAEMVGITQ